LVVGKAKASNGLDLRHTMDFSAVSNITLHIPPEIITHIFFFFDFTSLSEAQYVCKQFYNLAQPLWKWVFQTTWGFDLSPENNNLFRIHNNFREIFANLSKKEKHFDVIFEQNGKIHMISQSINNVGKEIKEITLKKAPFQLWFLFNYQHLMELITTSFGIFLSFFEEGEEQDERYNYISCLTGNADKELFAPHCMIISPFTSVMVYYESDDDHTFEEILRTPDLYICKRSVGRYFTLEKGSEVIDENFPFESLVVKYGNKAPIASASKKWLGTEHVKINFE